MLDRQRIQRAALEEALRQIPAGVVVVEAPSEEITFVNSQGQEISEQYFGRSMPSELGDLRQVYESSGLASLHPDGRPYEFEELPLMRSIRNSEEVRDEAIVHLLADGRRYTLRCDSSPIYDEEGRIVAGVLVMHNITEQRRAEETSQDKAEYFRSLVDNVSDIVTILEQDGTIRFISPAVERVLGYTPQELVGKRAFDLVHPEDIERTVKEFEEALKMREAHGVGVENRLEHKDGSWRYLHGLAINLLDASAIGGILISSRDVTERKQADERFSYHAHLLENMQDAVIATDEQFVLMAWNRGAQEMFGWTADEVLGHDIRDIIPRDYSDDQLAQELQELTETGRWRGERVWYRKDGALVYAEGLTIALRGEQEGQITGYLGIMRDVSERKRAEEALRESNRRTEVILESTTDAFFTLDREWHFTYINERGLRQLQGNGEELTREEVLGKNAWELYPELVGSVFYQKYHEALREQKAVEFEAYAPLSERWYEVHAYPSEEGLALNRRDISERKHMERELRESKRRNEEILESVTDGFYAMDRDWRFTYLNARAVRFASQLAGKLVGEEFTHEGLLGRTLWETLPATVGTNIEEEYRRAVREQQTTIFEYPYPGGSQVFEVHAYPSEQGLSVYFQDITERKRAEEQLAYYARLREHMHEAFIATDERLLVKAWNKGAEKMYGWTASEALGRDAREVASLEMSDEQLAEVLQEIAETGRLRVEQVQRHKDGTPFHVDSLTIAMRNERGETTGYLAINRDITERKRVEEEVEKRTRQQAAVAELGLQASVSDDLQALLEEAVALVARTLEVEYVKIVELLPDGEEMLLRAGVGWREGLVGRATEPAASNSEVGYALRYEAPVVVEDVHAETRFEPSELIRDHGIVSGMTVVIHGQEEEPFGVLCAHSASRRTFSEDDVNFLQAVANVLASAVERNETERRLEEVREAERSRVARDLHDEALQDLTDALVEAQLARATPPEDPKLPQRLEMLVAALDRVGPQLRGAIYDLRLEAEQERPFSELLEGLVRLQNSMNPEAEVRLDLVGDGAVISGPFGELGREILRMLREALTNARRHSGARNVRVAVRISEDEDKLLAEVEDDGRGFDPAGEDHPAAAAVGGVGTRGMAERARLCGGDLKIESEPGRGTKVSLVVPLEKDPQDKPQEQEEVEESKQEEQPVRVLLVDDHTAIREALAVAFQIEGDFEVVGQAGSLAEARRMLEEVEQVDVAIVDLGLPDGYGGDLIEELREANPQSQTLVLSASLDRSERAHSIEAGAAGTLHKSAQLEEVVESVKRLRRGEVLLPLEDVVELLRFAGSQRREEYEARQAIDRLTAREREVLQALGEGLDSEGIAQKLHISLRTERNHMSSILAKLGVHSQLQALVFAVRHGVVEIS